DDDDDAWEPLPQISPADALECLYKLRLFEEQQADYDERLIQHLMRHERVHLQRMMHKKQQTDIRTSLGGGKKVDISNTDGLLN
ncbi:uncharacterized protein P174DRAFT_379343, partial [Aspergillus novofumigatus IBT 16806]